MEKYFIGLAFNLLLVFIYFKYMTDIKRKINNLVCPNYVKAQTLLEVIVRINKHSLRSQKLKFFMKNEIPYKKFNELLNSLLALHKAYGVSIDTALSELRQRLIEDIDHEKSTYNLFTQGFLELIIIMFLTWFFVYFSTSQLKVSPNLLALTFIFIWQLMGIILFIILFNHLRKKIFNNLDKIMQSIYIFDSLSFAPIAISDLLSKCNFSQVINLKDFNHIKDYYLAIVQDLKKNGHIDKSQLSELIKIVSYTYKQRVSKLSHWLKVLKFLIICLFFALSYFLCFYLIVSSMYSI